MTKRERAQLMLEELTKLQQQGTLTGTGSELSQLTERILREESEAALSKVRGNSTLQAIQTIANELDGFKRNFDLNPLKEQLSGIEMEVTTTLNSAVADYSTKIEGLRGEMQGALDASGRLSNQQAQTFLSKLTQLESEFSARETSITAGMDTLNQNLAAVQSIIAAFKVESTASLREHGSTLEGKAKSEAQTASKVVEDRLSARFNENLAALQSELMSRLANHGGGNMNRNITVNGTSVLTKFTDINFLNASAIAWVTTVDNTNKWVNIMPSLIRGGSAGPGGDPGGSDTQVQFNDGGAFGGDAGLTWNKNTSVFSVNSVIVGPTRAINSILTLNGFFPAYSGADVTIAHANANYSSVVQAIGDTSTIGGTHYVGDGTYTEGSILIRRSGTRLNLSGGTTIQANGSTVATLISPSVTGLSRIVIDGGKLLQTNATAQGVAIDLSDAANNWISKMRIEEFGTGIKMYDTANTTFYNSARDIQMFNVNNGIDLGGTQPNANLWDNVRIRPKAGGAGTAVNMSSVRGNVFLMVDAEPGSGGGASIVGVHIDGATRDNLFLGMWIENNEDGVLIDQGADNNVFIGGNITSNTNDIRDSGTNTVFWGVNKTGTKLYKVPRITDTTGKAQLTFTENSGTVRVGQPGSLVGALQISASTAGIVTVQVPSSLANWNLTLPANDGTAGQYLLTDGNGITQWASVTAVGGSGITRNVSIITADTTGGTTAATDYVYFINAGLRFTLPTAVGNSNLYTVKNNSSSSVLVLTSAGQDIDGSATALMPTNNESLSFISNNSVWGVV